MGLSGLNIKFKNDFGKMFNTNLPHICIIIEIIIGYFASVKMKSLVANNA
jgi:hypothetical protein